MNLPKYHFPTFSRGIIIPYRIAKRINEIIPQMAYHKEWLYLKCYLKYFTQYFCYISVKNKLKLGYLNCLYFADNSVNNVNILLVLCHKSSVRKMQAVAWLTIQVESDARDCECSESQSDVERIPGGRGQEQICLHWMTNIS